MARIIISDFVNNKLEELVVILHSSKYFGTRKEAKKYVDAIYAFMYQIDQEVKRATQDSLYGKWYCWYKPNKKTSWYIVFDIEGEVYLIRNIFNNYSPDYPRFISSLR